MLTIWSRRWINPDAAVVVFYGLFYLACSLPLFIGGNYLGLDTAIYYLPSFLSPPALWTSTVFSGFPVAADPQEMTWYPVARFLASVTGSWTLFLVAGYALASCFTYAYVLSLTRSRFAALIAGLVFGMSGWLTAHVRHGTLVHTAAWLPMLLLCLEKLRTVRTGIWTPIAAVAVGLSVLAGFPQLTAYSLGLAACYALFMGWSAPIGRWLFYRRTLLGLLGGVGLACVLLIPLAELASETVRLRSSYEFFASFSFPLWMTPILFFPFLYGGMTTAYEGAWLLHEMAVYVGILPLVMACVAGFAAWRTPATRFWIATAFLSFLLAMPDATPLGSLLYELPVYGGFRVQARHFMEFSMAASVLAGLGIAVLEASGTSKRLRLAWMSSLLVGSAMLCLALLVVLYPHGSSLPRWSAWSKGELPALLRNPEIYLPFLFLGSGVAVLWRWCRRPTIATSTWIVVVLLLDLGLVAAFLGWRDVGDLSRVVAEPAILSPYADSLRESGQRLTHLYGANHDPEAAPPNWTRLWEIPATGGCTALRLKRYRDLLGIDEYGHVPISVLHDGNRALDILAARYVVAPRSKTDDPRGFLSRLEASDRWRHVGDLERTRVYENLRAMPRAWIVSDVRSLRPDLILWVLRNSILPGGEEFDPARVALVEDPAFELASSGNVPMADIIVIPGAETDIAVHVETRAPAFLVLSDIHYPGWQATVDGEPTPIARVNYVLRGLRLDAGSHIVQFEYRPSSLRWGGSISALSALCIVGAFLRSRKPATR